MKYLILIILFTSSIFSQLQIIDSLYLQLKKIDNDSLKANLEIDYAFELYRIDPDSGIGIIKDHLRKRQGNYKYIDARAYNVLSTLYWAKSDFAKALQYAQESLRLAEILNYEFVINSSYTQLGLINSSNGDNRKALDYHFKANETFDPEDIFSIPNGYGNIGQAYLNLGILDSAEYFILKAVEGNIELGNDNKNHINYGNLGVLYTYKNDLETAIKYIEKSIKLHYENNNRGIATNSLNKASLLGELYMATKGEKAKEYLDEALEKIDIAEKLFLDMNMTNHLKFTYGNKHILLMYKGDLENSEDYFNKFVAIQDSFFTVDKQKAIAEIESAYQIDLKMRRSNY